eukprot:49513-Eustigmatos_ZCMA.PRE.1
MLCLPRLHTKLSLVKPHSSVAPRTIASLGYRGSQRMLGMAGHDHGGPHGPCPLHERPPISRPTGRPLSIRPSPCR